VNRGKRIKVDLVQPFGERERLVTREGKDLSTGSQELQTDRRLASGLRNPIVKTHHARAHHIVDNYDDGPDDQSPCLAEGLQKDDGQRLGT
jgi:hypothetical protein